MTNHDRLLRGLLLKKSRECRISYTRRVPRSLTFHVRRWWLVSVALSYFSKRLPLDVNRIQRRCQDCPRNYKTTLPAARYVLLLFYLLHSDGFWKWSNELRERGNDHEAPAATPPLFSKANCFVSVSRCRKQRYFGASWEITRWMNNLVSWWISLHAAVS